jgi:predicted site-specific integrase-resolvase
MNIADLNEALSNDFVTVEDVSRALGLARNTIGIKIKNGQIEAVNLSPSSRHPRWLIRSSSVKRLLGIDEQVPA